MFEIFVIVYVEGDKHENKEAAKIVRLWHIFIPRELRIRN